MTLPYILFYSLGCPHSKKIIEVLSKHPNKNDIESFCVDGHLHHLPSYIEYVPTLRIHTPEQKLLLVGNQITEWLGEVQKKEEEEIKNMENNFDQDPNIINMDQAFDPSIRPKSSLDDIWEQKVPDFDPRNPSISTNPMDSMTMDEKLRELSAQRDAIMN